MIDDWQDDDFWADVHVRWLRSAAGKSLPQRQDFWPEDFSPYLGWLCFVSVKRLCDGLYDFHFRVGGTEVVSSIGYEVTGKSIEMIEPAVYREEIRKHYTAVVNKASPMLFELTFSGFDSSAGLKGSASYCRMCLPFGSDEEGVTHLLNCSRGVPEIGEILQRYS